MPTLPEHGAQTRTPASGVPASESRRRGPGTLVRTIEPLAVKKSISRASIWAGVRPITPRMP